MIVLCINDDWGLIAPPEVKAAVRWTPVKDSLYEVCDTLTVQGVTFYKLREDPHPEDRVWFLDKHFREVDVNIEEVEEVLLEPLKYGHYCS